jgi:hypothetical protein
VETVERRIGFCGDECSACPRYLATLDDDEGELRRVARLWHELGFRGRVVTTAEIRCDGCRPDRECAHGIAACAKARSVEHCGQCPDLLPCVLVQRCFERTEALAERLRSTCPAGDYDQLERAFLRKRQNLEPR